MRYSELREDRDDDLERAMWWVQRWVSGSMNDPDWSEGEEWADMDFDTAMEIVHRHVGNKLSVGKRLWRFLAVKSPKKLKQSMMLQPNHVPYQSFTISKKLALVVASELSHGLSGTGVIVSANVPPADIMFSMSDLRASPIPVVQEYLLALGDWVHQNEVIVRVTKPIPLLSVELIKDKA